MKKPYFFILGAWLIHAAAWFLPATKGFLDGLVDPVPGWEAFLVASCALRPCGDTTFDTWYAAVLAAISVIATLLFLFASPWVVLRGSRPARRASAWAALAAFIVNTHWYVLDRSGRPDLGIGYFLWWLSFALLSAGLFDLAGRIEHRAPSPQPI